MRRRKEERVIALCFYTLAIAIVLAFLEVQIEGKDGWAAGLPCWRAQKGILAKIVGGRPLTGYHIGLVILLVLVLHFSFFLFEEWKFDMEVLVWGLFFGLFLVEDFTWFVINPAYGLRRFRKENIPWHPNWWGPVPDFYWWYAAFSVSLIAASQLI